MKTLFSFDRHANHIMFSVMKNYVLLCLTHKKNKKTIVGDAPAPHLGWDGAVVAVTHNKAFADALQPTYVARVEGGAMKTRMVTGGTLSKKDFSPNAVATGGVAGEVVSPGELPRWFFFFPCDHRTKNPRRQKECIS